MLKEQDKVIVNSVVRGFKNCGIPEQDLAQEGHIALIRARGTFNAELGIKFETYASRVIKNRFIDLLRRENERTGLLNDQATTGTTIEDHYNIVEKSELVRKILNTQCTPIERAIFNSYARGHGYDEISKIFDITKKKIDNTIQKIRNKIRQEMQ